MAPSKFKPGSFKHQHRSRKRARTKGPNADDDTNEPLPDHLRKLPFELLSEVCMLTRSPEDLLSLARTSKHFCNTLIAEDAEFVWRAVRNECKPVPLPEPVSIFTEVSYAAFVFDDGICENCGTKTPRRYTSFSLRARLCRKEECRKEFSEKYLHCPRQKEQAEIELNATIPKLDNMSTIPAPTNRSHPFYYTTSSIVRKLDYDIAQAEYLSVTDAVDRTDASLVAYGQQRRRKADQMKLWMKFCSELQRWNVKRIDESKQVVASNRAFGRSISAEEGWEFWHLNNTPTFCQLFRKSNSSLELISRQDYNHLREIIIIEQLAAKERRDNCDEDQTSKHNLKVIQEYHGFLQSTKTNTPLPNICSFEALPIVKQLRTTNVPTKNKTQGTPSTPKDKPILTLSSIRKSPVLGDLVKTQIDELRESAKADLAALIGVHEWKTASSNKLHPADHANVRFKCRRCKCVGTKHFVDECLDFGGAFGHLCPKRIEGKVSKPVPFRAKRFEVDEKPGEVTKKVFELYEQDVTKSNSLIGLDLLKPGTQLVCQSCEAAIYLSPPAVIGHSHRHDSMQVDLITLPNAIASSLPKYLDGIALALAHANNTEPDVKTLQEKKIYGCRHCLQIRTEEGSPEFMVNPDVHSWKKWATGWHGIVSHLKATHAITSIRDEDVFAFEEVRYTRGKKKVGPPFN